MLTKHCYFKQHKIVAVSIKEYSISTHLINSRLQLIKRRLVWDADMVPEKFMNRNYQCFQDAVVSIARKHSIICAGSDMLYAAHLFLISVGVVPELDCYVVMYMPGKLGKPVSTPDQGKTILPADPNERLTPDQARERLFQLAAIHGNPFFWLKRKFYYDEFKP